MTACARPLHLNRRTCVGAHPASRRALFVAVLHSALACLVAAAPAADLGLTWDMSGRGFTGTRELIPMIRQGSEAGVHLAICTDPAGTHGAWRAWVEPAIGAREAGIWFQADRSLNSGYLLTLGGNPGLGGLALRSPDGKLLWADRFAPWHVYQAYVLEGVVESGKVRCQMFEADAKTLVSQSPWIEVSSETTEAPGALALYTRDALARFWGWERSDRPLSPIVDDAPNKRRLIQDEGSPWLVVGPGNWMWTTAKRERLRQYATIERSSALRREPHGADGTWECRVKVDPGAGGAGMLFLTNPGLDQGFIAWLGGDFGRGSLMLYRMPLDALWSGAQDKWHYSTEYVLRGETLEGKVRAQLLRADGVTLMQQTPWLPMRPEETARDGLAGFMTWLGTAEFWGFSDETAGPAAPSSPTAPGPAASPGPQPPWLTSGDGTWTWAPGAVGARLAASAAHSAVALNTSLRGVKGTWRCGVKLSDGGTSAGLLFQADKELREGFAAVVGSQGFALETAAGNTRWRDGNARAVPGVEYVLEGEVMTDRVAVRLFAADGKTLLSECPAVYVSEANNSRPGALGLLCRGGRAEFRGWALR